MDKCRICGKPLSTYNKTGECYCHSSDEDDPRIDQDWIFEGAILSGHVFLHEESPRRGRYTVYQYSSVDVERIRYEGKQYRTLKKRRKT